MATADAERREKLRATLIAGGLLPELVDAALQAAEDAGQALPTALDVLEDSEITAEDIAQARRFWLYSDDVPARYKRLLSAVRRF